MRLDCGKFQSLPFLPVNDHRKTAPNRHSVLGRLNYLAREKCRIYFECARKNAKMPLPAINFRQRCN